MFESVEQMNEKGYNFFKNGDVVKATKWYKKASSKNSSEAFFWLGIIDCSENMVKGVGFFQKSADMGYAIAQYMLSLCFFYGLGVIKDPEKSKYWFVKASPNLEAKQLLEIGKMFFEGKNILYLVFIAIDFLAESVNRGNFLALTLLNEVTFIQKASIEDLVKQSDSGDIYASYQAGAYYQKGQGIDINKEKAFSYMMLAAEAGMARAQRNIGISYINGDGVMRSLSTGRYWEEKAASQGDRFAKRILVEIGPQY